jgi:hypothetical protein
MTIHAMMSQYNQVSEIEFVEIAKNETTRNSNGFIKKPCHSAQTERVEGTVSKTNLVGAFSIACIYGTVPSQAYEVSKHPLRVVRSRLVRRDYFILLVLRQFNCRGSAVVGCIYSKPNVLEENRVSLFVL